MDKRVIVAEGQGVNPTDFARMGAFPQDGIDRLTRDLLFAGMVYSGFNTVKVSNDSVNLQIASGTLYKAGRQFTSGSVETRTIADIMPTLAGKSVIALVVAAAIEVNENLENRYYERDIDPSNPDAGVTRTVDDAYRVKSRNAVLTIIAGAESTRPVAPAAPTDACAIAEVLITTSGIQKVTMRADTRVQRLDLVLAKYAELSDFLEDVRESVDGLRSDLAAVSASGAAASAMAAIGAVENDLANIKERLDLPVDGAPYYADQFLDYSSTDYDPDRPAAGNLDFDARIDEGVRFAYEAESVAQLALLAPNDTNLTLIGRGLICPAFDEVDGLRVARATSDMPLGGVSVQTTTVKLMTKSATRIRYGTAFTVSNSSAYWKGGGYDSIAGRFRDKEGTLYAADPLLNRGGTSVSGIRLRQIFKDKIEVNYEKFIVKEKTISGVVKAETFLQPYDRWVTGQDLGIKRWADTAEITAILCECDNSGRPDPTRALSSVTLKAASFKAWPLWTSFDFDEPIMLAPLSNTDGQARAYAVMWFTTGDVDVMTADGSSYTGGTLLSTTDLVYYEADVSKDICFKLRYAKFRQTNLTIKLKPWQLSGGIENIDIQASILAPNVSSATFRVMIGGKWRNVDQDEAGSSMIGGAQGVYDAQVVLHGNSWSMPIIDTVESRVRCTRPKAAGRWIGAAWGIGQSATQLKIKALVGAYDSEFHTVTAAIRYGAGYATVKLPTGAPVIRVAPGRAKDKIDQSNAVTMEWTFDFASPINGLKPELIFNTSKYRVPFHIEQIAVRKSA